MIISVFDRAENIVGKGEIACASNFSFSHNVFQKLLSQTRQKVSLCGKGLKMALQILGRKFNKNSKKSSLFSESLLIFIYKTPVVESHRQREKLDIYYGQGRHRRESRPIFT